MAEMAAFDDAYQAAPPEFQHGTGMHHEWAGSALVVSLPASDAKAFNRILGLGVLEPASEEMIDLALAFFQATGVSPAFQMAPIAQPAEVTDWLYARGLEPQDSWIKFYRDRSPVEPVVTDLYVTEIGPESAWHFADVLAEGFGSPEWQGFWMAALVGRPDWHIYVAYDGDTPAATGAMFCRDGVGWLGFGATHPDFRRRGAQGAIMAKRLEEGMAMGCEWFVTETWEPEAGNANSSLNNMMRGGFQVAHRRLNFAYPEYAPGA